MAKGFGPQKSREATIIYKFTDDPSRPGCVILQVEGLTRGEVFSIIPGLAKKK